MALKLRTLRQEREESMALYKVDRRLWLTADRQRVVEDGDPEARFLLTAGPGDELPMEMAKRYGLAGKPKAVPEPPEDKMMAAAPEDKATKQPRGKSGQKASKE